MKPIFIVADNIVSPLGYTSTQNFARITRGETGVQQHSEAALSPVPVYAALFEKNAFGNGQYSKFEQLLIASISGALQNSHIDPADPETILIISTTKGNISLLETEPMTPELQNRLALHTSARVIGEHFKFGAAPLVISNACISGLLALITGMRLIQSGQYKHAVVAGADVISRFVLSGFQSFQAVSSGPCKPFDAARTGINLGEGAATVVLSAEKKTSKRHYIGWRRSKQRCQPYFRTIPHRRRAVPGH